MDAARHSRAGCGRFPRLSGGGLASPSDSDMQPKSCGKDAQSQGECEVGPGADRTNATCAALLEDSAEDLYEGSAELRDPLTALVLKPGQRLVLDAA